MAFAVELLGEHLGDGGSDRLGARQQPLDRGVDDRTMVRGPMCIERCARTTFERTHVRSDEFTLGEDFDHARADAHLHPRADVLVRRGVLRVLDFDVVVGMDLGAFPLRVLVGSGGQRLQRRLVELDEARAARAIELLERSLVQLGAQRVDRGVQFGEREEPPIAQPREDPALDDLHAGFDLGLVARFSDASRQGATVSSSQIVSAGTMYSNGTPTSSTLCTVEILPDGGGTKLILTDQSAFFDGRHNSAERRRGWVAGLRNLASALTRFSSCAVAAPE